LFGVWHKIMPMITKQKTVLLIEIEANFIMSIFLASISTANAWLSTKSN
jgi:hypothetical protein